MHPHYSIGIAHDNPRLILSIGEFHDKDEKHYQIWDYKSFVRNINVCMVIGRTCVRLSSMRWCWSTEEPGDALISGYFGIMNMLGHDLFQ